MLFSSASLCWPVLLIDVSVQLDLHHHLVVSQEAGQARFTMADIAAHLQPLLERLFAAFGKDDSRENEYVMKCVCRVVVFVGPEVRCCMAQLSWSMLFRRCLPSYHAARLASASCCASTSRHAAGDQP